MTSPNAAQPYISSLYFAAVEIALGNKDEAFRRLNQAYDERCGYLINLEREPMADSLRSDPRFAALVERIRHNSTTNTH